MTSNRALLWFASAALLALAALLPLVASPYLLRLATIVAMYAVLAQSWNFIGGLAAYPSFGTAAFFGLGAYVAAILQNHGVNLYVSWAAGGVGAALFAAFLGGAILHLRGHYFAIASLVVAEVLREVINTTPDLTGGGMGLNVPALKMGVAAQAQFFFHAMLALFAIVFATALVVHSGKSGFALGCIKQNEDAATILGVNTYAYKAFAFTLSAVFVGVAGGVYSTWTRYIDPTDVFDVMLSVKPLVMVLLGGVGTLAGPVIGAFILLVLEELVWRNFLQLHAAALGLIIVVLVLFLPNGVVSLFRKLPSMVRMPSRIEPAGGGGT